METIYDVLRALAGAVFDGQLGDLAGPAQDIIDQAELAAAAQAKPKGKM